MKYPLHISMLLLLFTSCSKELHTVKKAKKYQPELLQISQKLFARFDKETFISPRQYDSLQISESEKTILLNRLKCPYIQIIYNDISPRFINIDSVILFTRAGFPIIGTEHDILIDMRKNVRDSIIPDRKFIKFYKIRSGIYYIQDYMPEF